MKKRTHNSKALMAARLQAEAHQTLANRTLTQIRFIDIAATKGLELEPVGRMAGTPLSRRQ